MDRLNIDLSRLSRVDYDKTEKCLTKGRSYWAVYGDSIVSLLRAFESRVGDDGDEIRRSVPIP